MLSIPPSLCIIGQIDLWRYLDQLSVRASSRYGGSNEDTCKIIASDEINIAQGRLAVHFERWVACHEGLIISVDV